MKQFPRRNGIGRGADIPADCPWKPVDGKTSIKEIFCTLGDQAGPTVRLLEKYCIGTYPFRWDEQWRLLYVLDVAEANPDRKVLLLCGDPPLRRASPSPIMSTYNWEVPPDLKAFYAVHGGFGDYEDDYQLALSPSILPPDRLDVMADAVPPGTPGIYYDTRDLLLFSPDGAGGGQCFRRTKKGSAYSYETVGWDHEGGVLSLQPAPFWAFWHSFLEEKISGYGSS